MSPKQRIQVCHSDRTLVAEISAWADAAGYEVDIGRADDTSEFGSRNYLASVLELTGTTDQEVDVIERLAPGRAGKIIAVTRLDTKTIESIRRLFREKSIGAIVAARNEFNTRYLAELLRPPEDDRSLTPQVLAQAIREGQVVVHYQPKVPFRTGSNAYGVEALCRIQHPSLGLIYPDSFIALAEAHDLIHALTDAVTVQAFRDLAAWSREGFDLRLALNVSPRLLANVEWFETFQRRCDEFHIDPQRITLEVTESSSQGGKVLALEILSRLRLKGFLLSIDDFGTGFSSLETLYKLPFGELKIDKGFVFDLHKSPEARTLVETTVSLARKLGLKVTAEGVESAETFEELRKLQCDDAQGYFISKPIAADLIAPFFAKWSSANPAPADPLPQLRLVHGLLAEILAAPGDDDDATIVLSAMPAAGAAAGRDIAARIPALLLAGDWLGCLDHVHRALQTEPQDNELARKLVELRREIERPMLTRALVIQDGERQTSLQAGESFLLGRESASAAADIAVPCRLLSRGSKNLRLFREGQVWQVSDLGSTNGHFHAGIRLVPHQPLVLRAGETLLEIGRTGHHAGTAWLKFTLSPQGMVELICDMADPDPVAAARRWIVFADSFSIGADSAAGIAIPDCDAAIVADISLREGGLWIEPRPGRTVQIGKYEFSQAVPLSAGMEVRIGSRAWQLRSGFAETADAPLSASA